MVWTIINIIVLIAMIIIAISMYTMMNSFGELIVRFIEQNQEYYKNQKHLLGKSSTMAGDLKKLSTSTNTLKKITTKLERQVAKDS